MARFEVPLGHEMGFWAASPLRQWQALFPISRCQMHLKRQDLGTKEQLELKRSLPF